MPIKPKIQDQTFLFTGTLTEFTRDEAEALVEANGGKVLSGVSAKLNYLVVGEDAGSKLEKAKSLGTVTILTEKEFLAMTTDSSSPKEMPKQKATPSKKPAFKGKKLLDAKTAKKSISDYVDLDEYDSIEPKAASILAAEDSSLNLNGIKYLDLESAKALSKHKGEISLNGLLELDSNVAKELAKHNGSISLDGLKTITSESAQALSNSKFDISLDGIEELDDASFFENHTAYLSLKGLRTLNDKISEQLSKKKGGLDLDLNISDSLKELNPAKAKLLVKYYSKVNLKLLHLDGIKYLDLESAKVLSKFEGKISLNGLLELDSNVAKELAKHNGSISLNGLKTITSESAQALSNSKFDISLDGIEELDDASAFVNHSASLSLQGLSSLNDKISEQLSKKKGGLDLDLNISDSLKELSPAKAKLLVKYYSDPEITLEALEVLTLDAAKELAKHKYSISLNLTEINVEVLNVLSKVDLSLNNVNTLSNDHFKAIANFKKGIALNGLKAIDVKAVKELVKVGTKLELLGVVSISDEVAKILATYKGELHLGCITLSEKSALYLGEVKRKPGKNELHLPNIESPSSIEGKGIDFLMKEGITLLSDFPKLDFNAERVVGICYALRGGWDYAWEIDSDVWESVKEDDEEFATFREIAKAVPDYDDWEPYFPESLKKNFEFYNQLADLCKVLPIKFIKLADEKIKTNKELMMKFLKSYQSIHHLLEVVGEKLQDDKDFVLEAVRAERGNLQYASKRLRDDTDIINCVLDSEAGEYSIGYASDRIRANKEIAARVLLKSGSVLEYLDSTIKGDKELVKIAVNNYRSAIKYAAKVLQSDKDFLLSLNRFTLTEVPKKIFSNVEFVKQIIERIYLNNLITDSGLDSDEAELVKEVFKKTSLDKETLERLLMISDDFTSEIPKEFQNDLGIAKILIAKDVSNLEYIPAGLRKNKELKTFIEHLENNDFEGLTDADLLIIIRYAGRKIDYENAKLFVKVVKTIDDAKRLINIESSAYPHLSADLKENKEIAEMALKLRSSSPGENLNKFPKKLLNDTDFILSLLEKEPLILEYLPSSYKKDKKIALSVLSKDIRCFQHLDKSLFGDNELIDLVIDGIDTNQKQVPVDFHFLECLEKVPDHIKANRDFAIRIARKGYVLNSFRNDKEIVLEALKVNPNASITMNTKKGFVDIRNAYLEVALLAAYRGEEPITEGSALFNRPNLLAIKFLEQIHDSKGKNLDIDAIEFIRASGYSCFHHNQIPSQDYEENDDYDEDENSDNDSDDDDYEDED